LRSERERMKKEEKKKTRKEMKKKNGKRETHSAHARRLPGSPRTKGCLIVIGIVIVIGGVSE